MLLTPLVLQEEEQLLKYLTVDISKNNVVHWIPVGGTRKRGHPEQRWTDEIDKFFFKMFEAGPGEWRELAQDRAAWKSYEDEFVLYQTQLSL